MISFQTSILVHEETLLFYKWAWKSVQIMSVMKERPIKTLRITEVKLCEPLWPLFIHHRHGAEWRVHPHSPAHEGNSTCFPTLLQSTTNYLHLAMGRGGIQKVSCPLAPPMCHNLNNKILKQYTFCSMFMYLLGAYNRAKLIFLMTPTCTRTL